MTNAISCQTFNSLYFIEYILAINYIESMQKLDLNILTVLILQSHIRDTFHIHSETKKFGFSEENEYS